jgi:ankyrin repeat protein
MGGMLLQGTVLADAELDQLIAQLRRTQYTNAVQKAYQKRLLSILPSISNGAPIDTVIANANGTTALHNACGLSHVEIVRWLVNHGANTQAKTAKGASVAACVAQPNAAAINKILVSAKSPKSAPVAANMAPQSVKGKSITFWKDGAPLSDQNYTFRQGNKNVLANNIPNGYGNALNYTKTGNNT